MTFSPCLAMVVFLSHVVAFYMGFWISREIFTKCFAFKNGAHTVFFLWALRFSFFVLFKI